MKKAVLKIALLMFGILIGAVAQALAPKVGEHVSFAIQYKAYGHIYNESLTKKVVKGPTKSNPNLYFVVWSSGYEAWTETGDITDLTKFCHSTGDGRATYSLERLVLPSGTYNTCKRTISMNSQAQTTTWFSDEVPFGVLKTLSVSPSDRMETTAVDFSY